MTLSFQTKQLLNSQGPIKVGVKSVLPSTFSTYLRVNVRTFPPIFSRLFSDSLCVLEARAQLYYYTTVHTNQFNLAT